MGKKQHSSHSLATSLAPPPLPPPRHIFPHLHGCTQAEQSAIFRELEVEKVPLDKVRIFCSPFSRTKDTAETVADLLKLDLSHIQVIEELRERYFGPALELQSHDHYSEIWALDEHDPLTGPVGGESVADVATRLAKLLPSIESDCQRCAVLIVSHGDTLQILQTIVHAALLNSTNGTYDCHAEGLINASILSKHRKYSLLTGELRRLG